MATCTKCGTRLVENVEVCDICGQKVLPDQGPVKVQPTRILKFSPLDAIVPNRQDLEIPPEPEATETPGESLSAGTLTWPSAPVATPPVEAPIETPPVWVFELPVESPTPPTVTPPIEASSPVEVTAPIESPPPVEVISPVEAPPPVEVISPVEPPPPAVAPAQPGRTMHFGPSGITETQEIERTVQTPVSVKAEPTRVMKFGPGDQVQAGVAAGTVEPVITDAGLERPLITIAKRLVRDPRMVLSVVVIIVGLLAIPYGVRHWLVVAPAANAPGEISGEQMKQFQKMVDNALPDKLEWGRDLLRKRLPTRFPEELMMDIDKSQPEVKFEDKQNQQIYFRFKIAYHFSEDPRTTWAWKSVAFFFRQTGGHWTLFGDRWVREDEIQFE